MNRIWHASVVCRGAAWPCWRGVELWCVGYGRGGSGLSDRDGECVVACGIFLFSSAFFLSFVF